MNTLETGEKGFPLPGISPDVAATAAVLRSLYLPGECRHLVALLQDDSAAPASRPERRVPPGCAGETLSDAAFLETVRTLLSPDLTPMAQVRNARDLRDILQIRVWFLDALQDEMRQTGAEGGAPRLPGRGELAQRLEEARARYGPDDEPAISRTIREQLRAA